MLMQKLKRFFQTHWPWIHRRRLGRYKWRYRRLYAKQLTKRFNAQRGIRKLVEKERTQLRKLLQKGMHPRLRIRKDRTFRVMAEILIDPHLIESMCVWGNDEESIRFIIRELAYVFERELHTINFSRPSPDVDGGHVYKPRGFSVEDAEEVTF